MDLLEFETQFPQVYAMFENNVTDMINAYSMNGNESLANWDQLVDYMMNQYEDNDYYGFNTEMVESQQMEFFDDRRDRDRRRRRRRFRDFDVRDILRLIFLRQLFDRRRRRH